MSEQDKEMAGENPGMGDLVTSYALLALSRCLQALEA